MSSAPSTVNPGVDVPHLTRSTLQNLKVAELETRDLRKLPPGESDAAISHVWTDDLEVDPGQFH